MDHRKSRCRIRVENRQPLQGLQKNFGGMNARAIIRPVRPLHKLGASAPSHVLLKDPVWIVEK